MPLVPLMPSMVLLAGWVDGFVQLVTVLLIFVAVLWITALVTKWIAGVQKRQGMQGNIEVIETARIANNKYVQIVRVGGKYMAIAVCKDTVSLLGEVPAESLKEAAPLQGAGFRELLERAMGRRNAGEPKDDRSHDEK